MTFVATIVPHSIIPALGLWLAIVLGYFLFNGSWKFKKFRFSVWHYYILMLPLLAGLIISSWQAKSVKPLILFIIFALAGVIGEALTDLWWQKFYVRGLWIYNVETVFRRFTSWLNFLPWALGGLLYLNVANRIVGDRIFPSILPIAMTLLVASVLLQIFLFNLLKPSASFKFHQARWFNLIVIYLPIVFTVGILARIFGPIIYELALWFAVVGTIAEYLFGKACHIFISKKLWDYTYWSVDSGHFTLLSIPLFCIGGFYFWIISIWVNQYLF